MIVCSSYFLKLDVFPLSRRNKLGFRSIENADGMMKESMHSELTRLQVTGALIVVEVVVVVVSDPTPRNTPRLVRMSKSLPMTVAARIFIPMSSPLSLPHTRHRHMNSQSDT